MREYTNFNDVNGNPINEGDILLNPMICDLWIVEKVNNVYWAYLIPNSGYIGHPDKKYPAYEEELEYIHNVFEIVGNRYDNPELTNF